MSSLSAFKSSSTYHLLSYGTLLGSNLFQSFIGGVVAYRCLPRAQFSTLQKNIFPTFFALQTVGPVALLLTHPSGTSSLLPWLSSSTSIGPNDSLSSWLIGTMFATALFNLAYISPETTKLMSLRKHQETRDGKKSHDAGPHSEEMQKLNKQFGILHGMSVLVNLGGLVAMIWYGGVLGEALKL